MIMMHLISLYQNSALLLVFNKAKCSEKELYILAPLFYFKMGCVSRGAQHDLEIYITVVLLFLQWQYYKDKMNTPLQIRFYLFSHILR